MSGLAATEALSKTPAAANLLSGTSSNPLDDLVSIFGGGSTAAFGGGPMGGIGMATSFAPMSAQPPAQASQGKKAAEDDLLGLF